jgi:hypothetical protein
MSKVQEHRDAAADCLKRAAGVKSANAREQLFKIARTHLEYVRAEEERELAAKKKLAEASSA